MKTFKSFSIFFLASAFILFFNSCKKNTEELGWFQLSDHNVFEPAWNAAGGEEAQTLDIRPEEEYNKGHIPGAIPYPATAVNTKGNNSALPEFVKQKFDPSKRIFICGGSDVQMAMITCGRISRIGFLVMGLDGGFNIWEQKGSPVDKP